MAHPHLLAAPQANRSLTIVVLLAVAAAWTMWLAGGQLHAAAAAPVFDSKGAAPPRLPLERAAALAATAEPGVVQVVDAADGSTPPVVEVWQAPRAARQLDPATCQVLARATDGRLTVPLASAPEGMEWIVRAPHYRAVVLPPTNAAAGVRVALRRAVQQRLRCTGPAGVPVAGARITLTRASAPRTPEAACGLAPGGDPRSALYTGHTDADGSLVLDGLTPGTYAVEIQHDLFLPADPRACLELDVPTRQVVHIDMVDLLGCVLTPPAGDFVETSAVDIPRGALRTTVLAMTAASRAQDALRAAHPGAFVHVFPATADVSSLRLRGKVLLRQFGFLMLDAELRPLRTLQPAPLAVRGEPQRWTTLQVHTPRAEPTDIRLVLRHDEGGVICHVPLPLDRDVRVPAGTYSIDAPNALLRALLPRGKAELVADQRVDLPLDPGAWRVVHLNVLAPSGDPIGPCSVRVERDGRHLHGFVAHAGDDVALTVPDGRIAIAVTATGFLAGRAELNLPDDLPTRRLTMHLDYGD